VRKINLEKQRKRDRQITKEKTTKIWYQSTGNKLVVERNTDRQTEKERESTLMKLGMAERCSN